MKIRLRQSDAFILWRDRVTLFLASCFYTSYLPPKIAERLKRIPQISRYIKSSWTGSGMAGSLVGFATYLLIPRRIAMSMGPIFLLVVVGILFSVWVSDHAERLYGVKDDSRIVIDEWIGIWVSMMQFRPHFGMKLILAFVLFRIFDVYKGPWNKKLQDLRGGWGVVMDDVAAGVVANILIRVGVMFGVLR